MIIGWKMSFLSFLCQAQFAVFCWYFLKQHFCQFNHRNSAGYWLIYLTSSKLGLTSSHATAIKLDGKLSLLYCFWIHFENRTFCSIICLTNPGHSYCFPQVVCDSFANCLCWKELYTMNLLQFNNI